MAKNKLSIQEANLYEWISSTGYLLPSSELELARFELLHPSDKIVVDASKIDPFAIIDGTRKQREFSFAEMKVDPQEQQELRMAARRQGDIPDGIILRIKKNQQRDDTANGPESA